MPTYDYNAAYQDKVAALIVRDYQFYESTRGLILPDYFQSQLNAAIVATTIEFYETYRAALSGVGLIQLLSDAISNRKIRKDLESELVTKVVELMSADISDKGMVIDKTVDFAKHQEFTKAITESMIHLQKGEFDKIEIAIKKALNVGSTDNNGYDFYDEVQSRTATRLAHLNNNLMPTGITTGINELDYILYHRGYGRKELSAYMGPAKSGKSTALIWAAVHASLAKHSVLYITLEVSREIAVDRMDACLTNTLMTELQNDATLVAQQIDLLRANTSLGHIKVHEFPSGSLAPSGITRLIQSYKRAGIIFDLVIVDYLDIMRPDHRSESPIENSRTIWVDTRAIAQGENFAILSATQTNRDGFNAGVATSVHVSDDINKVRTADLVISINATDEEKQRGEMRLHLAAGRNQADGLTMLVQTDRARMRFVKQFINIT